MAQPPPNDHPVPQQIQVRMPLDVLAPWSLLDSAQHTLFGIANILQFINQPGLATEIRRHAEELAAMRNELLNQANSRIQLAGPGDLPKT